MKVIRHTNDDGEYRCFSISNDYLTRRGAVRVIKKIPETEINKKPVLFGGEIFCEFTFKNHSFSIEEPWGDSSEFDIVCEQADTSELEQLAIIFERHSYDLQSILLLVVFYGVITWSVISAIRGLFF